MAFSITLYDKDGKQKGTASGAAEACLSVTAYQEGDRLVFETGEETFGVCKVHSTIPEAILCMPKHRFSFEIPFGEALRGFAPGTFDGAQTVHIRKASEEELKQYRNLCFNPLDARKPIEVVDPDAPEWSNPTDSPAIAVGEIEAYPHAYADRVTRNEGCFYVRNAIDGVVQTGGHGNYPYHSWGGAVHEDLTLAVYFGRPVRVDKLRLYLRADYALDAEGREHDTYWHTAQIQLSDGFVTEIHPIKSAEGQDFDLGEHTTEWMKFSRLDPLQHEGSLNFAALTQIELWGTEA